MTQPTATPTVAPPPDEGARAMSQYLTFLVDREVFAVGIEAVKEILEYGGLTRVPLMPPWVRGVINLRGAVVPIVDLPARLGRRAATLGKRSCVVVARVATEDGSEDVGVLVDAVNEVLDIPAEAIEPPPPFGARIRTDFMEGVAKVGGRFVVLLDPATVLCIDELGGAQATEPVPPRAEPPPSAPRSHA